MNHYQMDVAEKSAGPFLTKNGFKKTGFMTYTNGRCFVEVTFTGYNVCGKNEENMTSTFNHNIHWLVGYLTWHGFIDKNYEQ